MKPSTSVTEQGRIEQTERHEESKEEDAGRESFARRVSISLQKSEHRREQSALSGSVQSLMICQLDRSPK